MTADRTGREIRTTTLAADSAPGEGKSYLAARAGAGARGSTPAGVGCAALLIEALNASTTWAVSWNKVPKLETTLPVKYQGNLGAVSRD